MDKKLIISAAGDTNRAVSETKGVVTELGEDKIVKTKYSIEYLEKMLGNKLSKNLKISLGKEYPMKIIYANDTGTTITYILAPRIDNS